ncbi:hypothetical protein BC567DRAFT_213974 [Phyllosticta citribraziliensis]
MSPLLFVMSVFLFVVVVSPLVSAHYASVRTPWRRERGREGLCGGGQETPTKSSDRRRLAGVSLCCCLSCISVSLCLCLPTHLHALSYRHAALVTSK